MKARCIDCDETFEVNQYIQGQPVANGGEWIAPGGHKFNLDPGSAEIGDDGTATILEHINEKCYAQGED